MPEHCLATFAASKRLALAYGSVLCRMLALNPCRPEIARDFQQRNGDEDESNSPANPASNQQGLDCSWVMNNKE
jgi:hypothetical protein